MRWLRHRVYEKEFLEGHNLFKMPQLNHSLCAIFCQLCWQKIAHVTYMFAFLPFLGENTKKGERMYQKPLDTERLFLL